MVRKNGIWGTVCDDAFTTTNGKSACYSLGLTYVSHKTYNTGFDRSTVPVLMGNVQCSSPTNIFPNCASHCSRKTNYCYSYCNHKEDIYLTCTSN